MRRKTSVTARFTIAASSVEGYPSDSGRLADYLRV